MSSIDPTRINLASGAIDLARDPRVVRISGITNHKRMPFDVPAISQIEDDLWLGGCVEGLPLPRDIVHVISLYPWESYVGHDDLRSVTSVVMYDALDQGFEQVEAIARWAASRRADGPTIVNCQAGLNRSSLIVATVLIHAGMPAAEAIALIREKRSPAALCNDAFEEWLLSDEGPTSL